MTDKLLIKVDRIDMGWDGLSFNEFVNRCARLSLEWSVYLVPETNRGNSSVTVVGEPRLVQRFLLEELEHTEDEVFNLTSDVEELS